MASGIGARTAGGVARAMTSVTAVGVVGVDLGTTFCYLEAGTPRVECRQHGVVVAAVPWARHDAWFTRSFDDQAAWLAVNTSKSAICQLMTYCAGGDEVLEALLPSVSPPG